MREAPLHIYLPIAGISLHVVVLVALGTAVGFLSGMFGIGGGFLVTPMLILLGVPAEVAVASGATQVVGTSVVGALAQWQRDNIDLKLGLVLIAGGIAGALAGVELVRVMRARGQVEIFIGLAYVLVLGAVGLTMLVESVRTLLRSRAGVPVARRRAGQHGWMVGLPLKQRFARSKLYISVIPPLLLGLAVGILSAVMGVGGGFILVPAMIYLLRVPTRIATGTSVLQIAAVTAVAAVLHAVTNQTLDIVLALMLLAGGVIGAEYGSRAGFRLGAEQLRVLLALLVLGMSLRLAVDLGLPPREPYTASEAR
jgi:hypothetical protein